MAAPSSSVRIARSRGPLSRSTVFRTPEALEEQVIEGWDVSLRHVLFDEVLLVTRHKATNLVAAFAVLLCLGFALLVSLAAGLASDKVAVGLVTFAAVGGPLLVLLILLLSVKVDIITVFGRRMRIRMRFWLRKERAVRAFDEICRAARQRQQRDRQAVATPPAPDPLGALPLEPSAP